MLNDNDALKREISELSEKLESAKKIYSKTIKDFVNQGIK